MSSATDSPWDDEPTPATPAADEAPAAPAGRRSAPVALGGRRFDPSSRQEADLPAYPDYDLDSQYQVEEEVDYADIMNINRQINRARNMMFRAVRELKRAQRAEAEARFEYKRAYNRVLAGLSGGSEKQRLATADLETEELYGKVIVAERLADEALNFLRAMRAELDSLAGLSHNVRAQMQVQ